MNDGSGFSIRWCVEGALSGDVGLMRSLVDAKVDVNQHAPRYGIAPLHGAAMKGHMEAMRYLVEDANANVDLWTMTFLPTEEPGQKLPTDALTLASMNGHVHAVRYLVEKKASMTQHITSPLHSAIENGHLDVVSYLLEEGNAALDYVHGDLHPIHQAAGNLKIMRYLVEEIKADIETVDEIGHKPIHFAAEYKNNVDVVRYLVEAHADVHACILVSKWTALHCAASAGRVDTIQYLLEETSLSVEDRSATGQTPLHIAAMEVGKMDVVRYLVEKAKANVEARTTTNETPLHYAILDTVKTRYLIEAKANVEAQSATGSTPLTLGPSMAALRYLVQEANANVNAKDQGGATLLHWISSLQHDPAYVRCLVKECDADIRAMDDCGKTSLDVVCNREVEKYLMDVWGRRLRQILHQDLCKIFMLHESIIVAAMGSRHE